ncbi:hypothetical protein [Acinetobacter gerneri]|uniref:hypothetical protein n=1 Tax=Acinetobacter gerneri TaxID=202952 RepID=UPI003215AEB5
MNMKYLASSLCVLCIPLTACFLGSFGPLPMDVNRDNDYLRDKDGYIVDDCRGQALSRTGEQTNFFWDKNNLPRGTTNFVCRDGKAYLPEKAPPKK